MSLRRTPNDKLRGPRAAHVTASCLPFERVVTSRPLLRKCFELSGIVPLGVYVVIHVGSYARALFGALDFGVPSFAGPALQALEIALVWLPFLFHAGYGCLLIVSPRESDDSDRSQTFWLRASGVGSLAFIVFHCVEYRWPLLSGEREVEDVRAMLEASLSSTVQGVPLVATLHLAGLSLVCLHLAIGFSRFAEDWGVLRKQRARRFARSLAFLLFATGTTTIVELATGSALPRF